MNDRLKNPVLHYGLLLMIYGTGAATLLYHTMGHAAVGSNQPCGRPAHSLDVSLTDSGFNPQNLEIARCDQLVFHNDSDQTYVLAVGEHEHHLPYPGFDESDLKPRAVQKIQMSVAGHYLIHDHDDEKLQANIHIK